jgi:PAS domain S-box-containing protein
MISVLYVDDEPGLLEIGKLFLERSGLFSVDTVTSAPEALEVIREKGYDAIISDYQMPEMNGIEFLKQVRASGFTLPFIIFTGRGREEVVIQALNEGADFYLQKGGEPVSQFTELVHKVQIAVTQRRAEASIHDHERLEKDIINFLPDATFAIDIRGVVIAWNRAMEKMTGVTSDQILGKDNYEYALPFYHERRPILIDLVLRNEPLTAARYPYITRAGNKLFSEITIPHFNEGRGAELWFTASPLYNTQGTIIGAIESIRDVTDRKQAETALTESEARYRTILDSFTDAVVVVDPELRCSFGNKRLSEWFDTLGLNRDIIGKPFPEAFPFVLPTSIDEYKWVFETGEMLVTEESTLFGGMPVITEIRKIPLRQKEHIIAVVTIVRDITERRRAEDAIRESEEKYRTVFETTGTATVLIENDGTISLANSEFERLSGFPKDEIENQKKWMEFVVKEDLDRMLAQHRLRRVDRTRALTHYEFRFLSRSGEIRDIFLTIDVIPGTTKSVASLLDITERKKAEDSLVAAHREYTGLLDQIQDVYYRSDPEGRLIAASRSWATLLGYDDISECLGRSIADDFYFSPPERKQLLDEVYRNGKVTDYEVMLRRKDGTPALVSTSSHLYYDPAGNILGVEGTFRDITERKDAEEALQESEERFRTLADAALEGIMIHDRGIIIDCNSQFAELFGYKPEEIIGRNGFEFMMTAESRDAIFRWVQNGAKGSIDIIGIKKDGTRFYGETAVTTLFWHGKQHSIVQMHDISARKESEQILQKQKDELNAAYEHLSATEEELHDQYSELAQSEQRIRESETKYRELAEMLPQIIFEMDMNFRVTYANRHAVTAMGLTNQDLRAGIEEGINALTFIDPSQHDRIRHNIEKVLRGEPVDNHEYVAARRDGTTFPALIYTAPIYRQEKLAGLRGVAIDITDRKRTEEILRESQERFKTLFEKSAEAQLLLDSTGKVTDCNAAFLTLFALKDREEIRGHSPEEFAPEFQPDGVRSSERSDEILATVMKAGMVQYEWAHRKHDAAKTPIMTEVILTLIFIAGQLMIHASIRDITDRKQAEEALRDSQERYRNVVEDQTEFISRFTGDGMHVFVNEAYCRYFGLKRDEILGHRFRPNIPAKDRERVRWFFESLTPDHPVDSIEHRIIMPDGSIRWQRWSDRAIFDPSGTVTEYQSVGRDITEHKKAEEALRESEEKYRLLAETSPDMVYFIDPDGFVRFVNSHASEAFHAAPGDLIGKHLTAIFPPDAASHHLDGIRRVMTIRQPVCHEIPEDLPSGRLWIEVRLTPVISPDGTVNGVLGISRDITDRKLAEELLRESEATARALINAPTDSILLLDTRGVILDINETAAVRTGRKKDELIGVMADSVFPDDIARARRSIISPVIEKKQAVRFEDERDGIWFDTVAYPVIGGNNVVNRIAVIARDITERKRTEEVLKDAKEFAEKLIQTANAMIVGLDSHGTITLFNQAAEAITGYSSAELAGRNWFEVLVPKDRYPYVWEEFNRLLSGGLPTDFENPILTKSGEEHYIIWKNSEIRDKEQIIGTISYGIDITERKRAEQIISEANKKINLLTSITRHDVANQVSLLKGYAQIAMMQKPDPVMADLLAKIDTAGSAIAQQIEFTKAWQELGIQAPGWYRVSEMVARHKPENIALSCHCDVEIVADPMLEKVFLNLIDNCIRHGERVTTMSVRCENNPDGLAIIVEDDGIGVPIDEKEKIFDKGYGKNSGLGLFLVREILAITRITIREAGTPGKGAKFVMTVPKGSYRIISSG